jgi:glycosyltransferase involved in cell wall biosynthesis
MDNPAKQPMKILLINSEYPPVGGGASTASENVAGIWAASGHHVTVLTARYKNLPPEEIMEGVRIIRIPSRRKRIDRSTPFEQISFMLHAIVHSHLLVRGWRPDATVAYFGVPSGPAALLLKMVFGIPYIISLRGGDVPGFRSYDFGIYHKLISPLLHIIWRQAEEVVANSKGLEKLARTFDRQLPIRTIPNGVDANKYQVTERNWDPPIMLAVGRLVRQKGIDVLLSSLATILDLSWRLIIVGDGKDKKNLERLSAELGLEDRVHFTGWKSRDELLDYFSQVNLFVHTSFDEGMSNAVLEAMACGLPVLATGISGNLEVVIDGKSGILVPPRDTVAINAALRRLLPDADLRQKYGAFARERVAKDFRWEKTARDYLDLLKTIKSN